MTTTIAVAGKGGTGKTTIAGLIVRSLVERAAGPVLAIDADPSSNLNAVLGMDLERTVGDIREDTVKQAKAGQLEAGVAKADLLDYEINACLEEGTGVDLLAMGRPEGPHCYCAANTMLRTIVDRIAAGYEWVVMDTEAGLEHISRRTTRDVDLLLVVTDPTMRGVTAAGRVAELVAELGTRVTTARLVVNRVVDDLPGGLAEAIAATGLEVAATIAADPLVNEFDATGRPLVELPDDDSTVAAVRDLVDALVPQPTASQGGAPVLIIGENIQILSPAVKAAIEEPRRDDHPGAGDAPGRGRRGHPRPQHRPAEEARRRDHAVDRRDGAGGDRRPALARHDEPRGDGGGPQGLPRRERR